MRSLLVTAAVLFAVCSPALAQTTATGTGTANSSSQSQAIAVGGGGGTGGNATAAGGKASIGNTSANSQIIFNTPGNTTSRTTSTVNNRSSGSLKTVPSAYAPGLGSAGIESCNSSASAGGSALGWGISFGGPIMDNECNLRLWARTLYAMGQRELVGAVLAQSPTINRAMQIVDQQRQPNGQVVYGAPARAAYNAGGNSSGLINQGCQKWSGGAKGVGSCLY